MKVTVADTVGALPFAFPFPIETGGFLLARTRDRLPAGLLWPQELTWHVNAGGSAKELSL